MNYKQKSSMMRLRANELKKHPTMAELAMIKILDEFKKNGKIKKYYFQSPRWHKNCFRIFDFWIPNPHRLRIEVDGGYHNHNTDKLRDEILKKARPTYRTIRFSNQSIFNEPNNIKYLLDTALSAAPPGMTIS